MSSLESRKFGLLGCYMEREPVLLRRVVGEFRKETVVIS